MRGTVPRAAGQQWAVPGVRPKGSPHGSMRQMRQGPFPAARRAALRGVFCPRPGPAGRPERHTKGARGPYFVDTAQKPPAGAAGAKKAPPRRRPKGKGPGGKLGALLADLDRENARRGKKGLPPLSYGKYVQLFGR